MKYNSFNLNVRQKKALSISNIMKPGNIKSLVLHKLFNVAANIWHGTGVSRILVICKSSAILLCLFQSLPMFAHKSEVKFVTFTLVYV